MSDKIKNWLDGVHDGDSLRWLDTSGMPLEPAEAMEILLEALKP